MEPCYRPLNPLLYGDDWFVPQPGLGLGDVIVSRHAAVPDFSSGQLWFLADQPHDPFRNVSNGQHQILGKFPHVLETLVRSGDLPDHAGEIPEVDGRVVGDEEGLAVDLLVVQWGSGEGGRVDQGAGKEAVSVGHVFNVGEVEEILVGTQLEAGLVVLEDIEQVRDQLNVGGAENGGRSNRAREQLVCSVRCEDESFSFSLAGMC